MNTKVLLDATKFLEHELNAGSVVFKIGLVNGRSMGGGSDA